MTGFAQSPGDSSIGVQTPEGIEFVLYPAGLLIRSFAWGIDACIKGVASVTIFIAVFLSGAELGYWFPLLLMFALDWFYHTAFEVFFRGQSPGKRVMGIRVLRSDGSPVNPGASFLRNLLRFADSFMFLYAIAFTCMLVSPAFRRLGDWAADTFVVYTEEARQPGRFMSQALRRPVMPWLSGVPKITPSSKLTFEEKQAILAFARRYPLLGKSRADEIAEPWAAKLSGGRGRESGASASTYLLGIAHTLGGST